jgi:hypothetical protein
MAKTERESGKDKKAKTQSGGSFLDKILAAIFGSTDPEKEKKRLLKDVANNLKKSRYKFYNMRGEQVLPALAKMFFEIYKVIAPAQALLQNAGASNVLKTILIEAQLTEEQLALKDSLSEENIRGKLKEGMDTRKLAEAVKTRLTNFLAIFDADFTQKINVLHEVFSAFHAFVMYDYYFVLKKFDSGFPEKNLTYTPKFDAINGEYILDELKDFLDVLLPLDKNADWDSLFDALKLYRNVEILTRPAWKKLMARMADLKASAVMELLIKYIGKDAFFKPIYNISTERILDPYVSLIKTQTETAIQKILQEKKNQKTDQLVKVIFGSREIIRMKNYSEKVNITFSKKLMGGYAHIDATGYLKTFMFDYVKKDLREFCDFMVVRGKWTTNLLSQQVSDTLQKILAVSDDLIRFDDACSDEGVYGLKLKKALPRAERDPAAMRLLRETVNDVNKKALAIIIEAAQVLISIGKNIKSLIDDYDAPENQRELIINWKEVDNDAEGAIKQRMTDLYKKIYYFIQLMQIYAKSENSAE